jgi:hypothetical protein
LPLFCRHNRYTTDCPICSKDAVPQVERAVRTRSPRPSGSGARRRGADPTPAVKGPFATAGPYEDGDGRYEVRLERVPGGLRLADWAGGSLRRRAPRLAAADVPGLVDRAVDDGVVADADGSALRRALDVEPQPSGERAGAFGASRGRSGELFEELRVELVEGERARIARWLLRPGRGWELQEAPVMLPAARFAEALGAAAGLGLLAGSSGP